MRFYSLEIKVKNLNYNYVKLYYTRPEVRMGRPKRKLSPVKNGTKLRKLTDFGFSKPKNDCEKESDGDCVGDIVSLEQTRESDCDVNIENNKDCQIQVKQTCESNFDSKKDRQKQVKVVRTFSAKWQINRNWLVYDPVKKMMFCTVCQQAKVVNSFTTGCSSLKLENIQCHENPTGKKVGKDSHIRALEIVKDVAECETARVKQLRGAEAAVVGAMRNVMFLATHDLPNSLLEDLNTLCKTQGAAHLDALKYDAHTSYESNRSVGEFQRAITEVITDELVQSINKSPYFSVTLDESTDIATKQNLIVYIVYLGKEQGEIIPKSKFLGLVTLYQGATAQHIYDALRNVLTEKGVDIKKMCGVATDGAAVMTGKKSGVVQKLKNEIPSLLSIHCIAHRLALSSGRAADSIVYLVKFQEIVNSLYKFFEYSPKHSNALKEMQEILEQNQRLKMKQVFHTRWLSFDGALRAVIVNYSSMLSVLLAEKSAKAQGLVKAISCFKFLYTAHFLADVMHYLCRLSKAFQTDNINFANVTPLLDSTVSKVKQLSNGSGTNTKSFLDSVPECPQPNALGQYEFEFSGHIVKDSEKQRKEATQVCAQFCTNVVSNMECRFDSTGDSATLTSICNVFDPQNIAKLDQPATRQVLEKDAQVISDHFSAVGHKTLRSDIVDFVEFVNSNPEKLKLLNNVNDVVQYCISQKDLFPEAADIALRFAVIPVSTVNCERGFSRHNLIKTKTRNSLNTATVENLMHISITKPASDFNYKAAFEKWVNVKKRRII